jgi:6-pyruvoyltetrahydropterin/6-carboxytetrahydropterin synthase
MYTVTVSDHVMIAHSFRGAVFGPAQRLHGATYTVEASFRRRDLDEDGIICDIGRALDLLKEVLAPLAFANLDELPEFTGKNTTTEFLAGVLHARLKAKVATGALGAGTAGKLDSLQVVLRESPVAWAGFDGPL